MHTISYLWPNYRSVIAPKRITHTATRKYEVPLQVHHNLPERPTNPFTRFTPQHSLSLISAMGSSPLVSLDLLKLTFPSYSDPIVEYIARLPGSDFAFATDTGFDTKHEIDDASCSYLSSHETFLSRLNPFQTRPIFFTSIKWVQDGHVQRSVSLVCRD